jgi:hypothetical protein
MQCEILMDHRGAMEYAANRAPGLASGGTYLAGTS